MYRNRFFSGEDLSVTSHKVINTNTLLISASVFLVSLIVYTPQIIHLSPILFSNNNGPFFGADTVEISDAMRQLTFSGDMRRYFLFSVATAPVVYILEKILRISENRAIVMSLGLIAASNLTLGWRVLSRFVRSRVLAIGLFSV